MTRLRGLQVLFLIFAMAAVNLPVANADEPFRSTGPAFAHPGMSLFFEAQAEDVTNGFLDLDYELLSSPTNVYSFIGWNRGTALVIGWQVDAALLGTIGEFVIRTTVIETSFVMTNVLRIPVVAPPPIQSLHFSNGQPVVTVTNLPVAISYQIQAASSVTASNWAVLATTSHYTTQTRFVDTLATNQATRFYRLRPPGFTCYTANCP